MTEPEHKLTQELLEKWAKKKADAWAWENYAPNDRAYSEYDLGDSWFEYEDGEYYGEIELKVTIGVDYEDHWEQMGYSDMYEPEKVIREIYNLESENEDA